MPCFLYKVWNRVINFFFHHKGRKIIAIYCDQGVGLGSVIGFLLTLPSLIDKNRYCLQLLDGQSLQSTSWESQTALLIIPGGRARPYYQALGAQWQSETVRPGKTRVLKAIGPGNQRIQEFVKQGGSFLGVCAGAYYGATHTVFEKGGALEVLDEGALKFFSGEAIGPAYGLGFFSYRKPTGAQLATVQWRKAAQTSGIAYYNGGCFFSPTSSPHEKTLMIYQNISDQPPAVILCSVGQGKAILSGIHFEMGYHLFRWTRFLTPEAKKILRENSLFQAQTLLAFLTDLLP